MPNHPHSTPPPRQSATIGATATRSARQHQAVELTLCGHPPAAIAQTLHISVRSVQRYLQGAQPLLAALRQQRLERLADKLSTTAETAIAALAALLADGQPRERLRAAVAVLAEARSWTEAHVTSERLHALEQRLSEAEELLRGARGSSAPADDGMAPPAAPDHATDWPGRRERT